MESNSARASGPSRATVTAKPSRSSPITRASTKDSSSSAMRTVTARALSSPARCDRCGSRSPDSASAIARTVALPAAGSGALRVRRMCVGGVAHDSGSVRRRVLLTVQTTSECGEDESERRPFALPRVDLDVAVVVGGDVAHDRKPEPGAAGVAAPAVVDPVEALEDALEVTGGDADALVLDVEAHLAVCRPCPRSARRCPRRRTSRRFRAGCRPRRRSWRRSPRTATGGEGSSSLTSTSRCSAAARRARRLRPSRG